jgi:hypothetical protein
MSSHRWDTGANSSLGFWTRKGRAAPGGDRPHPIPVNFYSDRAPEDFNGYNQTAGTLFVDKYAFDPLEGATLHSHQIAALKVRPWRGL